MTPQNKPVVCTNHANKEMIDPTIDFDAQFIY